LSGLSSLNLVSLIEKPPMTRNAPLNPSKQTTGHWLHVLRLFCLLALGLSGYLLYGSLTGERLPGCGVESGCSAVLSSRWAYVFGIPVSLPALTLYGLLLIATVVYEKAERPEWSRGVRLLMLACASALFTAALWFICLQLFVIGSICPFCMAAHTCGALIAGIILVHLWKELFPRDAASPVSIPRSLVALSILLGIAGVAAVAIGQRITRPKTFAVASSPELGVRKSPRLLQLHGDLFQLDLREVPLMGSPEAPAIIVQLFDYSCPHCRALHPILLEACRALSNQLAVASLPMPLATNCNPLLKRSIAAHTNACAYARAGLAVWRANPAKQPVFDEWIFSPSHPPSPEVVEVEAMRLVGTNAFQQALKDPWVQQQLDLDIRLYGTNYFRYHNSVLPELMIGTNIVSGSIANVRDLYSLLSAQFDLRLPAVSTNPP
jgi:uncharacterized membrane protein